jgi:DNA polymerase III delta prime subunit
MEKFMELKNAVKIIENEFCENLNSHVFLLETNNYDKCLQDVKNLIKKIINADEITSSQIDDENYIELIIIRSEGKEILKDQIEFLQERLKTKPILSNYLFYIIIGANLMNDTSSNKLLKTIEEPSENNIGFLLTSNIDSLLPTIKSRCEILSEIYENEVLEPNNNDEVKEIAEKLIKEIEKKDLVEFNKLKSDNKIIKDNGKLVANYIKDYYNTACNVSSGENLSEDLINLIRNNNAYNTLIKKAKYLNKTLNKLTLNMNSDLLLEMIFIELKEVK